VRGVRLAWREWGNRDAYPVLALHGWLDNAASFDTLAPLLGERRIIALDLPGHGLSAHRGVDGTYNIWDDLPTLMHFTAALDLERYDLLGHSRGAAIASLLAAAEVPAVSSLVMLDGALIPLLEGPQTLQQLRSFTHDYAKRSSRDAPVFPDVEAAITARCTATGIDPRAARLLVPRSLDPVAGGFRWRTDPRLRYASALKFTRAQVRNILSGITVPTLIFTTGAGMARRLPRHGALDWYPGLQRETVEGCHHCHMLEAAPVIAERVGRLWRECGQA
jgi:pimeloyl-ACP methyl ester carboxylesterase